MTADVFRVLDALNDVATWSSRLRREEVEQTRARNDLLHGKCAFTVEGYVQMAKELMDLDSNLLCIKNMATLLETLAGV